MVKCVVCDTRPARRGPYCGNCASKIAAETRDRDRGKITARYFLHYRGILVGLYATERDETGQNIYAARLEHARDLADVPQSRVINLDTFLPGYTREQVKKFKAACLSLAN
jgi:hypothetical protein